MESSIKRLMRSTVAFCLALSPLLTVAASDWDVLDLTIHQSVELNKSTVRWAKDGSVRTWIRTNVTTPKPLDSSKPDGPAYLSVLRLLVFRCEDETMGMQSVAYYSGPDGTGELLDSLDRPAATVQFSAVVPDTIGAAMFRRLCPPPVKR